jgi:hypothetical protein
MTRFSGTVARRLSDRLGPWPAVPKHRRGLSGKPTEGRRNQAMRGNTAGLFSAFTADHLIAAPGISSSA